MTTSDGLSSARMWGSLLRRFRVAAGITHEALANHVGYSTELVFSVERGRRMPSDIFVRKADEYVKADGWLKEAAKHLSRDPVAAEAADYVGEEKRARSVWAYDMHVLHPLLRIEAYSRAVLLAHQPVLPEACIETRAAEEHERQARLTAEPAPVHSFIIEEWILHRPTGGLTVMRAQLEHLVMVAALRNVTLQVMPTAHDAHPGQDGPMTLLHTPEHTWLAHLHTHDTHHLITDPDHLTTLHDRYTHLRSHALTPADTVQLIRGLAESL